MKITIHRGINQIGGCITEVQSASGTKILMTWGTIFRMRKARSRTSMMSRRIWTGCSTGYRRCSILTITGII